jgi:hypothetical protein
LSENYKNSLFIIINPSRLLVSLWALVHLVALSAILLAPLSAGWRAGLALLLAVLAGYEWRKLPGSGHRAVATLHIRAGGAVEIGLGDGSCEQGSLRQARILPGLVMLELACGRRSRRVPLMADAVAAGPFRRLRAMLGWQHWQG